MNSLILLRGLPGAGKSSLAAVLSNGEWPVFAIDDYFTDPLTGAYNFNFQDNHLAYKACETKTLNALQQNFRKVFVDNTFTMEWEMESYFKMAAENQYRVFVITVENRHDGKNIHNISDEQLQKMAEKYRVQLK